MNTDLRAGVLTITLEVVRYFSVQLKLALLHQLQNQSCRELFGDGAEPELRVRLVGNIPLHIGKAKTFFVDHLAILGHQGRTIKLIILMIKRDEFVYSASFSLRENRGLKGEDTEEDKRKARVPQDSGVSFHC